MVVWKDPNTFFIAELFAPLLAFVTAFIRSLYDGTEPSWLRRFIEAVLCGGATLTCGFALKALGAHGDWVYFVGGVIGLFGVDYVRFIARKGINKKVDKL